MTKDEALKLALEALENVESAMYVTSEGEAVALEKVNKAITAIKEALAQPEQNWKTPPQEDAPLVKWAKEQERNFCPRCGKRAADLTTIHTCTPPREKDV